MSWASPTRRGTRTRPGRSSKSAWQTPIPILRSRLPELCRDLGWGIPDVYIPLLFLALDGRCLIRQEDFFGDIWVQVVKADEES